MTQGSETAYIYGITYLAFFPVFCVCAGYGVIKLHSGHRRRARNGLLVKSTSTSCFNGSSNDGSNDNEHDENNNSGSTSIVDASAREWMAPEKTRPVLVNFGPAREITLKNR